MKLSKTIIQKTVIIVLTVFTIPLNIFSQETSQQKEKLFSFSVNSGFFVSDITLKSASPVIANSSEVFITGNQFNGGGFAVNFEGRYSFKKQTAESNNLTALQSGGSIMFVGGYSQLSINQDEISRIWNGSNLFFGNISYSTTTVNRYTLLLGFEKNISITPKVSISVELFPVGVSYITDYNYSLTDALNNQADIKQSSRNIFYDGIGGVGLRYKISQKIYIGFNARVHGNFDIEQVYTDSNGKENKFFTDFSTFSGTLTGGVMYSFVR